MTSVLVSLLSSVCVFSAFAAEPPTAPSHSAPNDPPAMAAPKDDTLGAVKVAKVSILEPKDGAVVPTTFKVKFGVEGMKIANAGTNVPGTGHHHLIVDGVPSAKGQVIPADATHLHFGKGQTEAQLTLKPGPHTLTLQFADGAHSSYGEMMSQTIHIQVK